MNNIILPNAIDITRCKVNDINYLVKELRLEKWYINNYNNWYMIDNKLYYFKMFDNINTLYNELVCEEIYKYMNLDSIHYIFAKVGNTYGLLSESFRDKNYNYIDLKEYNFKTNKYYNNINKIVSRCKDKESRLLLIDSIKRLMITDFYTVQRDRRFTNLTFQETKDLLKRKVKLAPLYDYSSSFYYPSNHYDSNIFNFDLREDLDRILTDDYMMIYFDYICSLNIMNIFFKIMDERHIDLGNDYIDRNLTRDIKEKELIRSKILNR